MKKRELDLFVSHTSDRLLRTQSKLFGFHIMRLIQLDEKLSVYK